MRELIITQAKPNPIGKDRMGSAVPSSQLAGEWVDFKNIGNKSIALDNIELQHIAYTKDHPTNGIWDRVTDFSGILPAGEIVRVHSGNEVPLSSLQQVDLIGADHHVFSWKGYVWNNDRTDSPRLTIKGSSPIIEIDKASYPAHPIEGKILKRAGQYLV